MIEQHLSVPGQLSELATIRAFVQKVLATAGLSEQEIYPLVWAVDESCSNIIRHAYRDDPSKRIWVTIRITDHHVEIIIEDEGEAFDPQQMPEPDLQQHWKQRKKSGLGIYILRRLVDQIRYEQQRMPGERNRLILVRKRRYNSSTIPS